MNRNFKRVFAWAEQTYENRGMVICGLLLIESGVFEKWWDLGFPLPRRENLGEKKLNYLRISPTM